MKILGLYNNDIAKELFEWIESEGHEVSLWTGKPDANNWKNEKYDLAVSYTYRYILKSDDIEALNRNVVNLHMSYLPWNRGASPNLWSIIEDTPKGVTLHYIDEGLDKGNVIAQEMVDFFPEKDTLKSSYNKLDMVAKNMFKKAFMYYKYWPEMKKQVLGSGTYHSVKDGNGIIDRTDEYDILIRDFLDNERQRY